MLVALKAVNKEELSYPKCGLCPMVELWALPPTEIKMLFKGMTWATEDRRDS